ncbi:endonuclease [Streptomyces sp. NBC_01498]|uniref:endonuclease n=1 Tax=Streptomyces sp. NBC_01498 TaxID=2975870 RepID=UPI002E7C0141|nr:endonuclease [Streptomyces sp. NBC_01498]WTL28316.1 endonuclease [Streptomyces sp. NBC_01498]
MTQRAVVHALLRSHGTTYAQDAGIKLRDTPQPLYQLLVLALLLSAPIRARVAVATSRALSDAGLRSAHRTADATWQQRVDALVRGGYRRYDESTATRLGDGADLLIRRWHADPRGMRAEADGDVPHLRHLLQDLPGIGPTGADIFLREVQGVWPEVVPYFDTRALHGADRLGLAEDATALARLAGDSGPATLAAALVRASLDDDIVHECLREAGQDHRSRSDGGGSNGDHNRSKGHGGGRGTSA